MNEALDGVTSYLVALFLIITSNMDHLTLWGGLLLFVVRMIADGPRAFKQIKRWFRE